LYIACFAISCKLWICRLGTKEAASNCVLGTTNVVKLLDRWDDELAKLYNCIYLMPSSKHIRGARRSKLSNRSGLGAKIHVYTLGMTILLGFSSVKLPLPSGGTSSDPRKPHIDTYMKVLSMSCTIHTIIGKEDGEK